MPFENLETFQGDHSLIFEFSKTIDEYDLSKAQLNVMDTDVIFLSEGNPGYSDDVPVAITKKRQLLHHREIREQDFEGRQWNMIIVNNLTILFVGIMLVIFLGRLFTKPILALTKATHQVAEGDFDVALPPERDDEIGELISSFGTM